MVLGEYIREMRKQKKLSLRELGERSNISHSTISQIENNQYPNPSRSLVDSLAKGLEVPPQDLLRMAGYWSIRTDETKVDYVVKADIFRERLIDALSKNDMSIEMLAVTCSIDPNVAILWVQDKQLSSDELQLPSLIHMYKIARTLNVTPDYLYGYANQPNDFDSQTPRPMNLLHVLDENDVIFDTIPLDDKDKSTLKKLIYTVFDRKGL